MHSRQTFLERVRQAVAHGNYPGAAAPVPERGSVGYQGADADPIERFCKELKNSGGCPHIARDEEEACQTLFEVVRSGGPGNVILGQGGLIDRLNVAERLRQAGLKVTQPHGPGAADPRDAFFHADVGITNVAHLVAETGSVVMASAPDDPRSLSLLPPVHVAIAHKSQLLPDLFDLFDLFSPVSSTGQLPPSCLTLITGPSKTGDIELRLVTGVHGPGEIHVVLGVW